ncbi:hypothetical protein J437_LFUL003975 [Ladona fulva]|uniref:Polynucleotide 5'-hydroxyl-kinase NOL9 n=1 Tax=Ladona fulva TaxID=123851 RepID=A0A8K0K2R3_LADFU|nr:hypothetical protein J437_LFUL003975 [Ladona fulva]
MSQHMCYTGRKMRKIPIVPPKVGKILKIGKMKRMKAKSNLKKQIKKKEMRKRMMGAAEECMTKKDVVESGEGNPSKISRTLRPRISLVKKVDSADANTPLEYADHSDEINSMGVQEEVLSDISSETWESTGYSISESLTDSDENGSRYKDCASVESCKHNEDEVGSECVVISSSKSVVNRNVINKRTELPYDKTPCLRIQGAKAEFHEISAFSYLLILRHPGQLYFRGNLLVTPVSGITSFLGYEFRPGMKSHLVFSPTGISPMFFSTTGRTCRAKVPDILGLDENILKRLEEKDSALLIEPASGEHWIKLFGFFNRLLKFNPLAPSTSSVTVKVGVDVEADLGMKIFQPSDCAFSKSFHRESSEWHNLSQNICNFGQTKGLVRVMVFGGKGVGKSTFMRFLVNKWLSSCNESKSTRIASRTVLFVDFDPGQSEFVPPGCLSVTLVSEPLLGPNYTHLKDPERMLCLGELDVSRCPKWYLYCADDLVKFCSSEKFKGLPWFINTMGFCKGIGADLAVELVRLCRPTHVIQITSIWMRRNFEPFDLLTWKMVKSWRGHKWNSDVCDDIDSDIPEYSYHQLQSLAESSEKAGNDSRKTEGVENIDSQGLPAWQSRELCILAYFSKIVKTPLFSILDAVPHTLSLTDLVFSLPSAMVRPQYVKSVFNAALVALSSLGREYDKTQRVQNTNEQKPWLQFEEKAVESDPKVLCHMPLAPCLGFGLVRGIDDSKEEIYIATPLSSETMATVDCLATGPKVGSIPAPMMLDSLKESKLKDVPYLMKKDRRTDMNRFAPRVFQPHLANQGAKR